jgi:hypothetical protein
MSNDSNDPKIVVDDDWKERVRAEREAARQAERSSTAGASAAAGSASSAHPSDDFALLVSMLATQALVALGKMPDPAEGHVVVRPDHAKQAIGMLTMIEQKTQGNLNAEETKMLDHLLHELRMLYVEVYPSQQTSPSTSPTSPTPEPDSTEEAQEK